MRALDQQPFAPLLPDEILREPVGQHGARRRDMNDIGAAVFLAQTLVGRGDVEEQRALGFRAFARREQAVGGEIGDDQPRALVAERVDGRGGVARLRRASASTASKV